MDSPSINLLDQRNDKYSLPDLVDINNLKED